ncbi:uncharacterized protein M421DRAFT_160111 [Didymella exigua CBS 183.55]|uniref:Uncharacterized protein n=1 Tax=Didymella exigua CBS 183.55 TaxID=1150837 RepID=A0A6A5RN16_9PLEO|nr:uncharacterized protein M421DRAFT_160111 [Didymella exigua CBS 183.55]KAF1928404.1 hypothetical protein M421DRAFT_160111 [Didymella exigua CBS 183.55]
MSVREHGAGGRCTVPGHRRRRLRARRPRRRRTFPAQSIFTMSVSLHRLGRAAFVLQRFHRGRHVCTAALLKLNIHIGLAGCHCSLQYFKGSAARLEDILRFGVALALYSVRSAPRAEMQLHACYVCRKRG